MVKMLIISLNDHDNYFLAGLRGLLDKYFSTQGIQVTFTNNSSNIAPDIIFHALLPGETGDICRQYSSRDIPLYFIIQDNKSQGIPDNDKAFCNSISGHFYRNQNIDEMLEMVKDALNNQNSRPKARSMCPTCYHLHLSEREREVLMHIQSGLNQTQTANHMQLKVKTVNSYKHSAMKKLNISRNCELLHWILRGGLQLDERRL